MTACKSSGLSKPTSGCECSYCTMLNRKEAKLRVDLALGGFNPDGSPFGLRALTEQLVEKRAWNEALAAKRKRAT